MYKPVSKLLVVLLTATPVFAPGQKMAPDTLTAVVQPGRSWAQRPMAAPSVIDVRTIPHSVIDSLQAADDFWYANAVPAKKEEAKGSRSGESLFRKPWFRQLLWIVILTAFVGVMIWYLVSSNIFLFRKTAQPLKQSLEETGDKDDIFSHQYEQEIAAARASGNHRMAIRLWYLQTLKLLTEKGLIDYRFGRTNQDYVAQLSSHALYRSFFRLTRNFEFTWYGQFPLTPEVYQTIENDFIVFQKGVTE